jgi:hypothetical protein
MVGGGGETDVEWASELYAIPVLPTPTKFFLPPDILCFNSCLPPKCPVHQGRGGLLPSNMSPAPRKCPAIADALE